MDNQFREYMTKVLIDTGELLTVGDCYFEDMGGHVIHESQVDGYIEEYVNRISKKERIELMKEYTSSKGV
jgi:hypothetical protein